MKKARQLFNGFNNILGILSAIIIMVIMALTIADVVFRWMKISVFGIFEMNSMLVGISVYVGIAFIQSEKMHISANILAGKGPRWFQAFTSILYTVLGTLIFGWFSYVYGVSTYEAYVVGERLIGTIGYPAVYLKGSMFLGVFLMTIQLIIDMVTEIKKWCGPQQQQQQLTEEVPAQ